MPFATYASLPVLNEAHEGEYGLPMDVWDLILVDEAHRTSASLGKAWAAVHDQVRTVLTCMRTSAVWPWPSCCAYSRSGVRLSSRSSATTI